MDRYRRQEQDYDRGEKGLAASERSGAASEFPWQPAGDAGQPTEVWEGPPGAAGGAAASGGPVVAQRNRMAIRGFVCSLLMWIPAPVAQVLSGEPAFDTSVDSSIESQGLFANIFGVVLGFILWLLALIFSSIGLRRSKKRGLAQRGLAISGICICLFGWVVVLIVMIIVQNVINGS